MLFYASAEQGTTSCGLQSSEGAPLCTSEGCVPILTFQPVPTPRNIFGGKSPPVLQVTSERCQVAGRTAAMRVGIHADVRAALYGVYKLQFKLRNQTNFACKYLQSVT